METFPFIVGCGRSGTTLLRAMLDAHPAITVPPESHFIPELVVRHAANFDTDSLLDDLLRNDRFRRWNLPTDAVNAALVGKASLPDALREIYRLYASMRGKRRYGDKTGAYAEHMDSIAALFDEAIFIHIIRDGRDTAISFLEAPFGPSTAEAAARQWTRRVIAARTSGSTLGAGRYLEIRYEALVAQPEDELRRLCDFIDLPFAPAMLTYHEGVDSVLAGIKAVDAHQRLRLPPTANLRDWRTQMAPGDVKRFDRIAGSTLRAFGYY